jgi:stage II sporulation protein D
LKWLPVLALCLVAIAWVATGSDRKQKKLTIDQATGLTEEWGQTINLSDPIPQAYAWKAFACLLMDTAGFSQDANLPEKEEGAFWYQPYKDYLTARGYWTEQEESSQNPVTESLTWGQARQLEERFLERENGDTITLLPQEKSHEDTEPMTAGDWWDFFEACVAETSCEDYTYTEVTVYGAGEAAGLEADRAVSSAGTLYGEGFSLTDYVDQTLQMRILDGEILEIGAVVSLTVTYENVWIEQYDGQYLTVFFAGFERQFPVEALEGEYTQVVADLTLTEGKFSRISLKRDTIEGKVLAVGTESIEVLGYGTLPLAEGACVYRLYGDLASRRLADVIVGAETYEFVVAKGEICAVLLKEEPILDTIRVLISNQGMKGSGHETVSLRSDSPMKLVIGGEEVEWPADTEFTLTAESEELAKGRIFVSADSEIQITSLERGYGIPHYQGTLELTLEEGQILVVNEVDLEQYLTRVVPSEMPAGHGLEALKAQAVCARSYAYNQIRANACRAKGAHVDDTTSYQVYNNSEEKELCTQAVAETAGQVLTYEGDVITAYYSSTTCGSTTDTAIWGSDPADYPYLTGKILSEDENSSLDLTDEETFRNFIQNEEYDTFDTNFAWYRWNLYGDLTMLSDAINTSLEKLGDHGSASVLVQGEDGEYRQQEIHSIGAVTKITVTKRGAGGIVSELKVEGTEAVILLLRQGVARSYLGNSDYVITKKDGSQVTGMGSLPSAFFCLEEVWDGENLTGYQIYGGGYGHGVGMSQNGAKTMANMGMGYEEILNFFYPGTEISNIRK